MISATTSVVLNIIVGTVLSVHHQGILCVSIVVRWVIFNAGVRMPDEIGFVDHQTIHLRIGETNSKLHHQMGIAIKTTQEGVRPRIAGLLCLGSKTEIDLCHQQI